MDGSGSLDRFVQAQAPVYADVVAELQAGSKRSHWMWFVFPQLRGLGRSPTAEHFGINGLAEARAYLAHPLLGARLRECTEVLGTHEGRRAEDIFGSVDAMKLRSSLTLFQAAPDAPEVFTEALEQFFAGERDAVTLRMLGTQSG